MFYTLTCKKWNPFSTSQPDSKSKQTEPDPVYTTAPLFKTLIDGEKVLPVMINEGKFFVRNKETNGLLKEINKQIIDCKRKILFFFIVLIYNNFFFVCSIILDERTNSRTISALSSRYAN